MRLKYKLRSFAMADGERYCLLADPTSGAPLFYPNLFVTTQVRNPELSTASMEAALAAINVLLAFRSIWTRSIGRSPYPRVVGQIADNPRCPWRAV